MASLGPAGPVVPTVVFPAPGRGRRAPRPRRTVELLFLAPAAAYLLLFFGYPIVKNIVMGFQHYTNATFFTGVAPWVGMDNYSAVIHSAVFGKAAVNTLLFTVGSIAGQFTIGLAIALYFQRRFPLSGVLRSLLLLPWLIPLIVSSTVWRWLLDEDNGAVNHVLRTLHLVSDNPSWLTSTSLALVVCVQNNRLVLR